MSAYSFARPLAGIAAAAMLLAFAPVPANAPLAFGTGSRVRVAGTSNVRTWRCESARVQGSIETSPAGVPAVSEVARAVRTAEVVIPVASLDCANGTMNNHLRRAMKADQFSDIRFRVPAGGLTVGGEGHARLAGTLSIAGQEKPASIEATVAQAEGGLRVTGTYVLRMTDFGVRPPTVMMGAFRVADPVTVTFDVVVK
ncbi:MAG TPA: YceI family protein [Longimicrobiaceae bacterium]|nr:YceI family protein [Longimicrobiaceae bacterium]